MSFTVERPIKAVRKARPCCGCRQQVEVGQKAIRWVGADGGDFGSVIYHPECRKAEIALNDLQDYRLGDDWTQLRDMERDDWPWLLKKHPAVAARFGITAERIAEFEAARVRLRSHESLDEEDECCA